VKYSEKQNQQEVDAAVRKLIESSRPKSRIVWWRLIGSLVISLGLGMVIGRVPIDVARVIFMLIASFIVTMMLWPWRRL
jgi:hypothetical protein